MTSISLENAKLAPVELLGIFQLLVFGLFAGLLGGLLGIGGGIVYVVILPVIFQKMGVSEGEIVAFTIGNSLFATLFTSLSANIKQSRDGNFFWKPVLLISIPAVVLTYFLLHFFVHSLHYSKVAFQTLFLVVLLFLIFRMWRKTRKSEILEEGFWLDNYWLRIGFLLTGLGAGAVSSLTGLGGGVFIVPILHSVLHLPIRKANSVSLGVISITSFFSGLVTMMEKPVSVVSDWQLGFVVFPVVFCLAFGGMIGSYWGVEISKKIKDTWVSALFLVFIVVVFLLKISEIFGK